MAITKLMHMNDSKTSCHGLHLKRAIEYITVPEKTQKKRLVGAVNCSISKAFEQMTATKELFGKTDKRQGYHFVISFEENEVSPDIAYKITEKFVNEYLGKDYEAVFAVHDNTKHIHSHIVFNSVRFTDGNKFHYKKGDWEKIIQPITNRLCSEYGLSTINISQKNTDKDKPNYALAAVRNNAGIVSRACDMHGENYDKAGKIDNGKNREWSVYKDGPFVWSEMIKRDIDACIIEAYDFNNFLMLMKDKGYEIKQGKYLAVRPAGMNRYRRCRTLGEDYTQDRIMQRIETENLKSAGDIMEQRNPVPKIVKCYCRRYKRAKLTGLQRKYYRKLYRLGKLKKKPYSQAWKYKDEIRKMHELQQKYLFLARHNIETDTELADIMNIIENKKQELSLEKRRLYRKINSFKDIFETAEQMTEIKEAEQAFQSGDEFFSDEHSKWLVCEEKLKEQGYVCHEVMEMKVYLSESYAKVLQERKVLMKELKIAEQILREAEAENKISGQKHTEQKPEEQEQKIQKTEDEKREEMEERHAAENEKRR